MGLNTYMLREASKGEIDIGGPRTKGEIKEQYTALIFGGRRRLILDTYYLASTLEPCYRTEVSNLVLPPCSCFPEFTCSLKLACALVSYKASAATYQQTLRWHQALPTGHP